MGNEPTTEELAAAEYRRFKSTAQQIAMSDPAGLTGGMIITVTPGGVGTVPYIHADADPREVSLWMLGAFLSHMDDSTPDELHPIHIVDHALSLMDDYQDDENVGWSLQTDEDANDGG